MLIFEEDVENEVAPNDKVLSDYASEFCRDGELWIQNSEVSEASQQRCLNAV